MIKIKGRNFWGQGRINWGTQKKYVFLKKSEIFCYNQNVNKNKKGKKG